MVQFELPLLRAPMEEAKALGRRSARCIEKELKDIQQICEDATRMASSDSKEAVRAVLLSAISRMKVISLASHLVCLMTHVKKGSWYCRS